VYAGNQIKSLILKACHVVDTTTNRKILRTCLWLLHTQAFSGAQVQKTYSYHADNLAMFISLKAERGCEHRVLQAWQENSCSGSAQLIMLDPSNLVLRAFSVEENMTSAHQYRIATDLVAFQCAQSLSF